MKRLVCSSLGLALALVVTSASAEEVQWRAASGARPAATASGPAVTMQAPVPLSPSGGARPAALKPVSFGSADDPTPRVVVRGQMNDAAKALPAGPEGPEGKPAKKASETLPAPHPLPAPPPTCLDCGACGGGPCCGNPDGCGGFCLNDCCGVPGHRFWLSGEYLMWWIKGQSLPPLVTAGSPNDQFPGAVGQPGTVVLFGNGHVENEMRSGARFRAGWWFDDEHTIGIDGSFFFLGARGVGFLAASPGSPALFRPFFNAGFAFNAATGLFEPVAPAEDAQKVAFPGQLAGRVNVDMASRLWGYEINLRSNLCNGCCGCCWYGVDGYVGFRSLGLDEKLAVSEGLTALAPPGGSIFVNDQFKTRNRFYGGQVGLDTEFRHGRCFLDLGTKVALGGVHQVVDIQGNTVVTDAAGGMMIGTGGLLTQTSNIGRHTRDRFAVMPEVGVNLGYQVCDNLRVFVGYNVLYLSSVVRPAQQIDRVVNPTLLPLAGSAPMGPPRPAPTLRDTDFYAQGVNFGLELRY